MAAIEPPAHPTGLSKEETDQARANISTEVNSENDKNLRATEILFQDKTRFEGKWLNPKWIFNQALNGISQQRKSS